MVQRIFCAERGKRGGLKGKGKGPWQRNIVLKKTNYEILVRAMYDMAFSLHYRITSKFKKLVERLNLKKKKKKKAKKKLKSRKFYMDSKLIK